MKKKILAVLISSVMILSMTACGGSSNNSGGSAPATENKPDAGTDNSGAGAETMKFEIVSKGFQHQYWQAVLKGSENKAKELGVEINFIGPNTESDIADQVQMFNNAINGKPAAIGLAALDTKALLDSIQASKDAGIPIVGFDSGVPGAPEGAILANCATDNYAAGELAGENTYAAIKDAVTGASGTVRIGVLGQDATSESIVQRGLGFIDKVIALAEADGKTVSVEGNDKYISDSKGSTVSGADVVIEVLVPAQVNAELSAIDCQTLLNKNDTIAIYGSNQHSGEAMVTANGNLDKFGVGDGKVIGVAFDSGVVIKTAVKDKILFGAVTQAPVAMGEALVQQLYNAATGASVADVDTGAQWYTADNMDSEEINQNLYD